MHIWRNLFDRLMGRSAAQERDLERELRADLELEAEEQQNTGVSAEEAQFAARRAFGNTTLVTEDVREAWGWTWLERLIQDTRFGLRQLGNNPGFTAVAILTLALGIGANTAIFTLVHAVMMKSLPVVDPTTLFRIGDRDDCCVIGGYQNDDGDFDLFSYDLYRHFRDTTPEFEQ